MRYLQNVEAKNYAGAKRYCPKCKDYTDHNSYTWLRLINDEEVEALFQVHATASSESHVVDWLTDLPTVQNSKTLLNKRKDKTSMSREDLAKEFQSKNVQKDLDDHQDLPGDHESWSDVATSYNGTDYFQYSPAPGEGLIGDFVCRARKDENRTLSGLTSDLYRSTVTLLDFRGKAGTPLHFDWAEAFNIVFGIGVSDSFSS